MVSSTILIHSLKLNIPCAPIAQAVHVSSQMRSHNAVNLEPCSGSNDSCPMCIVVRLLTLILRYRNGENSMFPPINVQWCADLIYYTILFRQYVSVLYILVDNIDRDVKK